MTPPTVDVAVPVYNERRAIAGCVAVLRRHLAECFPFEWTITIVDNGSTDGTPEVAAALAAGDPRIRVRRLREKGRGLALRHAWTESCADVVAYTDVDLSTDLGALLPLVAPLVTGHSDVAIASRLAPGARTVRSARREVVSRCYNALLKVTQGARFSDAQCGFKAVRREVVAPLLAHVRDDGWFFDTELLLLAEHNGLRIHEVPVDWVEDTDSRVELVSTAWRDVKGLARVGWARARGRADVAGLPRRPPPRPQHPDAVTAPERDAARWQLLAFGGIGVVSTAVAAGLYALLREWWSPPLANLGALTVATLFNTEANRRLTFAGARAATARVHAQGLVVFLLYYGFTSGALLALRAAVAAPGRWLEVAVLVLASAVGTVGRFVLLRSWVFSAAATQQAQSES